MRVRVCSVAEGCKAGNVAFVRKVFSATERIEAGSIASIHISACATN